MYAVYSFLSYARKKNRILVCISSKQGISWCGTHNFYVDKLTKKLPIVKMNCWTCFFHKCSYKNSCFNELVYDSSVLVLMICSHKDVLKGLALDVVGTFSFEGLLCFVYNFVVAICTYIRKLIKNFSVSSLKDV